MDSNTLIKFEDVSFRYESDSDTPNPLALEHLNLEIKNGEFVAVLGHNGSGKSTVAKLANAIAVPESGKITVAGMDTSDESKEYDIRQNVGVVMQNPDNQIVATIVEEDVAFGPENLGVDPDEIRKRVDEALKAVGMYEYRFHEPHKLSGGQKQRVAIAGIIAMRTRCIILDEPTAMLDPSGRRDVMNVMLKLNKEMGITVVFITHFMEEAIKADRVVIMDSGKKVADGTPVEVFANEKLITDCGLEMPPAAVLAKKLRDDNINLGGDILSADDFIASFEKYMSGEAVK
ncbi:MAG: energy-coupling factor transporter ATPase [Oscillospiraceae bacterium]|nr:energy-coupling factor transporter ATPase [Oscillospiraceae bacterium]MDD7353855.1 energy-coupling factor transporter ATPase [Oscillospiraceae bacterium]MDY3937892.1 energy-coupling factor transporter ATPase [Oscillospiraceae bacterium]